MRLSVLFLLVTVCYCNDSAEELRNRIRSRIRDQMYSYFSDGSSPRTLSSVSTSSSSFFPFGMMTGLISGISRSAGDGSSEESAEDDYDKKLRGTVDSFKDDLKKTVSEAEKLGGTADEDPLNQVGHFTDIVGSFFGKLASTIGSQMKADPMDRKSPFGIADVIGTSLTQLKGPHICIREVNRILTRPENRSRVYSSECQYYSQAVKCSTTKVNEDEARQTIRIQECCSGFTTSNIRAKGCNKEIREKTPIEFLNDNGVTGQIPSFPNSSTIVIDGSGKIQVFPQVFNDFDLENGQILTTTDGQKYVVKVDPPVNRFTSVSVNCIRLKETNVPLSAGKGHVLEKELKPAATNVLELLKADGRFTKFISILSPETVAAFTNESSSQTVLPFTDQAFSKFPRSFQDQISNRLQCFATGIARAHIFQPAMCSDGLKNREIGEAEIVEGDLLALNGIVHVVDDIIVKEELESWEDKLKAVAPAMAEKLAEKIEPGQPLTIFVPKTWMPDKADEENDTTEGSGIEHSGSKLVLGEEEVRNQVVPWFLPSLKALPPTLTTLGNSTIFAGTFKSSPSSLFSFRSRSLSGTDAQIGCSRIIEDPISGKKQLGACGASVFFLDKPIPLVAHNALSLMKSRPELSRFNELVALYLQNGQSLPRVVTLFIPVDDAFSVNDIKRLKGSTNRTAKFVRRHLVSRPICEQDFHSTSIRSERMANKNGEQMRYSSQNGEHFVEDSKILETVVTSDGVVHIVDSAISIASSTKSENKRGSFLRFNLS